jgi:large subunit ribosomal protein L15
MAISLSQLKPNPKSRKKRKRIGRGNNSSDPGTYSGRGMKGQRSRSGGKKGLKIKGMKNIIKGFPKKRGFKRNPSLVSIINLDLLEKKFKEGDTVNLNKLREVGLLKNNQKKVKILGQGNLKKKLNVQAHFFSQSAVQAITKAGGKIIKIEK